MISTNPPHPDWLPPEPRRSQWWLWLLVPLAPVAGYLLPWTMVAMLIVFILVVIRYSERV